MDFWQNRTLKKWQSFHQDISATGGATEMKWAFLEMARQSGQLLFHDLDSRAKTKNDEVALKFNDLITL